MGVNAFVEGALLSNVAVIVKTVVTIEANKKISLTANNNDK